MDNRKLLHVKLKNGNDYFVSCSSYEVKPYYYYDFHDVLICIGTNLLIHGVIDKFARDDEPVVTMLEISLNDIVSFVESDSYENK